ncbi:MAG: succinate dehydrogenase, cytochrome b556 subunit [Hyphomicrobiaceae bacterium]
MVGSSQPTPRPLSPHLQIYRPEINMVMSIVHRLTGLALYAGAVLLVWWLLAAASGPAYFDYVNGLWSSVLGRIVLLGYTWALLHHTLGGVRHLIWDTGRGLDIPTVDRLSWWTILLSAALTMVVWVVGYWMKGAI